MDFCTSFSRQSILVSGSFRAVLMMGLLYLPYGCNGVAGEKKQQLAISVPHEVTITAIRNALDNGEFNIEQLTRYYLDRIDAMSFGGPRLNAVITVNPDALHIAATLDAELKEGRIRGPLHGIPVLLKDNIDTADKMPCTAGSRIMAGSFPGEDSPLTVQLRQAGAVILGKANMSEWANFHSSHSSSGWSGLGGQTKNPYDTSRNPCGSSSGSAVAVAANLCVLAIGTETNGSIVCPANNNGIVGIKPTVGLVSRRGIVPISFTQDTGGPMARTVRDAAICLGTLTAVDSMDVKTLVAERKAFDDYTPFLKTGGIKGKRIGYYKAPLDSYTRMEQITEKAVEVFRDQGAEIIVLDSVMSSSTREYSFQVLLYEFKDGLNQYFSRLGARAPVNNLEELIDKTMEDSIETKHYNFELLKLAQTKGDLNSEEYRQALKNSILFSRQRGIDRIMEEHQLDAIIAPTGGPAWKTDPINGDNFHISSSSAAAIAGYPSITVPMGHIDNLPVGLSIFGRAWSEPVLLEVAYGFEQATHKRIAPTYKNSVAGSQEPNHNNQ
jgi:amidase